MRIDILNNMKAIINSEKRRSTRRWFIFAGVILGLGYLFILLSTYMLKPSNASDQAAVNQYEGSVIRVDAFVAPGPSKHASGRIVAAYHTDYRQSGLIHHEVEPVNPTASQYGNHTSNSQPIKVYTTSSAKARNLGAGISSGSGTSGTTVHVSSSVPFSTSTSSMVMSTAVWTSSRSLSAKNTLAAEQQLLADNSADAISHVGKIRRLNGEDDDDNPLEPMKDPVPLGDGLWALLIAAVAYAGAVLIHRRKQQAK